MRYFFKIAYDGKPYAGWQYQPNALTVQEAIESAFSTFLGGKIEVVGCGRTDSSVHASAFYFHVDLESFPANIIYKLNAILPKHIVVYEYYLVEPNAHARFDATKRSYTYHLHDKKNPFKINFSSRIVGASEFNIDGLNATARLISSYDEFYPFCKSNHDARTLRCDISLAEWIRIDGNSWEFHIISNRFLRGMVRLIVGACINVQQGLMTNKEIESALIHQTRLKKSYSAPADGLFLSKIEYPYIQI